MPYYDEFHFIVSEDEAICEMDGDKLILQPLATTRYVFEPNQITGDMKTSGIGLAYYEIDQQQWSGGGVLTRQQVLALRDFLDAYLRTN